MYITLAKANRYAVIGYYFESTLQDCIARNEVRTGKGKIEKVGVIAKYKQLQPPSIDEGFDELYCVRLEETQFVIKPMRL